MTYQNDELTKKAIEHQVAYGLTDEEMAGKLGIDPDRLSFHIEQGVGWSFDEACLLAEMTGCSLDEAAGVGMAHSALDPDDFRDATNKVKGSIAALVALKEFVRNVGRHVYDCELLEMVTGQLHDVARYMDALYALA